MRPVAPAIRERSNDAPRSAAVADGDIGVRQEGADLPHHLVIEGLWRRFRSDDPGVKRLIRLLEQNFESVEIGRGQGRELRIGEGRRG